MSGHLVKHAGYYWRLVEESHQTQWSMVRRITSLPLPPEYASYRLEQIWATR